MPLAHLNLLPELPKPGTVLKEDGQWARCLTFRNRHNGSVGYPQPVQPEDRNPAPAYVEYYPAHSLPFSCLLS